MRLLPIGKNAEDNKGFPISTALKETIRMNIEFYQRVGFVIPWIGYFAEEKGNIVGVGGFKGKPVNCTIEISYGTFENYRNLGVGTKICKELVDISLKNDPLIRIIARTVPGPNFSTKILRKNKFKFLGIVNDLEDGEVWEWLFNPAKKMARKKYQGESVR